MKFPPIVARYPHFLHGGDYNPDRWRHMKHIWAAAMRLAGAARCNAISIGIFAWSALEPAEGQ